MTVVFWDMVVIVSTTAIERYGNNFATAAIETAAIEAMAVVVQPLPYGYGSDCLTTVVSKLGNGYANHYRKYYGSCCQTATIAFH